NKSSQKYKILKFPRDEYQEVDKSLETIQFVYLNGKLPCEPNELIFSRKQYATNSNSLQPLYHQFVNDYATTTTIFLGTAIDEPIFEQYIAARETRNSNITEHRPQSFLIDPFISPARESLLKTLYNIECIKATTLEFSNWLYENSDYFLDREETLKITFPALADLYTQSSERTINEYGRYFNEFSSGFKKVNLFGVPKSKSKNFLLGTSPSWNDIYNNLDASRKITTQIFDAVEYSILNEPDAIKLFTLLGSAGCGKSTILKRLSLQLSQNGRTVFFSYSEYIPDYESIVQTINSLKQSVVLVFDNADLMLLQLPKLIEELHKCNFPPKIIISTRTNVFDRLTSKLESIVSLVEFKTPNLDRDEIIEVINKLSENNLLGNLKGLSELMRIKEFENRSKKQILVAMREATKGESFDNIIKSEYGDIVPSEARFLTACIALTTEAGFTVTKQDFVGFSDVTPAETLFSLKEIYMM
ncbi:MAG: SIR2 family protein, partial [Bacteroidota bacterium]|nr:SIR2 family protein [Bacteroidota bacterium]